MAGTTLEVTVLANKILCMEGDFMFWFLEKCIKILDQRTSISVDYFVFSVCLACTWKDFLADLKILPGKVGMTPVEPLRDGGQAGKPGAQEIFSCFSS